MGVKKTAHRRIIIDRGTEAEYMALTEASKEGIYLRRFIEELGVGNQSSVLIYNDNMGALKLAENPIFHSRTKHIHIRHHFVREVLASGDVKICHMSTSDMPADILTKGLPKNKHWSCMDALGVTRLVQDVK